MVYGDRRLMIIAEDDCCKLLIGKANEEERKVGYVVKIKQTSIDDDGHETYWCLTNKELKALINYLVKEL